MNLSRNQSSQSLIYVLFPLLVITMFGTLHISVNAREITTASSNPFVDYVDVFPGQLRTALEAHGFSCPASFFGDNRVSVYETCFFQSKDDAIRQVRAYVLNDVIQQTEFVMSESRFTISLPAGSTIPASSNPFVDYVDVFPGQPRTALEAHGFSCPASAYANLPDTIGETCILMPREGLFQQVRLYVVRDIIQQIDFVAR